MPRDLHYFPTRRSSDLTYRDTVAVPGLLATAGDELEQARFGERLAIEIPHQRGSGLVVADEFAGVHVAVAGSVLQRDAPRSEEHTSELQSQSNLVCRLL